MKLGKIAETVWTPTFVHVCRTGKVLEHGFKMVA